MATPTKVQQLKELLVNKTKYWAYCRYEFGLTSEEIRHLKPAEFKELKKLHDEKEERMEKLIARINLMLYWINTPTNARKIHTAKKLMYVGEFEPDNIVDPNTRSGQEKLDAMLATIATQK